MTETADARVAVYLDFDNIVISRYDQTHGRSQFMKDRGRGFTAEERAADPTLGEKLAAARVDVGAIIDFASSFGTLVLTRAYADWSAPVNAEYRSQLVGRAVDLVQLFPAAAYSKNGADIRLAVDAVEDMFRLPDLTHVVIVAGDSDYIALAQRCKRLGRYVVGIGVAGSTSKALAAACDEFAGYDTLPGVTAPPPPPVAPARKQGSRRKPAAAESAPEPADADDAPTAKASAGHRSTTSLTFSAPDTPRAQADDDAIGAVESPADAQEAATRLLERALRLAHEKDDDADWLHSSAVKTQMKRMDPSFSEKALGSRSFSDFVRSRKDIAELDESATARLVRLLPSLRGQA